MSSPQAPPHSLRWTLDPRYIEASRRILHPNEPIHYAHPRTAHPTIPNDVTEFHPGQDWTRDEMPDIMYQLYPSEAWHDFRRSPRPGPRLDPLGRQILEPYPEDPANPRPLLDFAVLPNRIGSLEENFVIEAWRRLDPRIQWEDILMRMPLQNRSAPSTITQRVRNYLSRFANMLSWHYNRTALHISPLDAPLLARLTPQQISNNTTRGLTPGLIDPGLGEAGGRILWPAGSERRYPRTRANAHHSPASAAQPSGYQASILPASIIQAGVTQAVTTQPQLDDQQQRFAGISQQPVLHQATRHAATQTSPPGSPSTHGSQSSGLVQPGPSAPTQRSDLTWPSGTGTVGVWIPQSNIWRPFNRGQVVDYGFQNSPVETSISTQSYHYTTPGFSPQRNIFEGSNTRHAEFTSKNQLLQSNNKMPPRRSGAETDDDDPEWTPISQSRRQARAREQQREQVHRSGNQGKRRASEQGGRSETQVPRNASHPTSAQGGPSSDQITIGQLQAQQAQQAARQEALNRWPTPHNPLNQPIRILPSEQTRPLSLLAATLGQGRARHQGQALGYNTPTVITPAGQRPPMHQFFRTNNGFLHPVQEGEDPNKLPIRLRRPRTPFSPIELVSMDFVTTEVATGLVEGLDWMNAEHREIFNDRYWLWYEANEEPVLRRQEEQEEAEKGLRFGMGGRIEELP